MIKNLSQLKKASTIIFTISMVAMVQGNAIANLPLLKPTETCKKENDSAISRAKAEFDQLKVPPQVKSTFATRLVALESENGRIRLPHECDMVKNKLSSLRKSAATEVEKEKARIAAEIESARIAAEKERANKADGDGGAQASDKIDGQKSKDKLKAGDKSQPRPGG